ncbi:secondary thiamine-phosphate synthase enzyme YjbQ [Peribacillus kribbensis]|uniref:secondary thiamine-phosphate synthase enzyme YjbQ n=1 Tax=Peribacillus kribbensis TaxID=356658 RepID=UPI00047E8D79|nr:secondary thiamine-phosphate synthase enzyme YjbQ [Peribacillus kribbensis]
MLKKCSLNTDRRDSMIEITREVRKFIREQRVERGAVVIYCPHTTAGITINENADPDVKQDLIRRYDELYPWTNSADLHEEGNTAAHLKAVAVGSSQYVIIEQGDLLLGVWQGIYFCEWDGPRTRNYYIKILKEE